MCIRESDELNGTSVLAQLSADMQNVNINYNEDGTISILNLSSDRILSNADSTLIWETYDSLETSINEEQKWYIEKVNYLRGDANVDGFIGNPSIAPFTASAVEKEVAQTGEQEYISSYAQLKAVAYQPRANTTYVLNDFIFQEDNTNNMEIVINSGTFNLDLNGYPINRSTSGTDLALFRIEDDAEMVIYDSSDSQTGSCTFITGAGDYNKSIFRNSGLLTIYGGDYVIESNFETGNCCILYADEGQSYIYGGTFDSSYANGGSSIILNHDSPMYNVPNAIVYGGDFYAKYINIEASAYNDFTKDGCLYPTAYVLGGSFYITKESDYSGFAFCNNGWGRVIVAGGTVPATCVNARDRRYLTGSTRETFFDEFDGFETSYSTVTPPPVITTPQFDTNTRLLHLLEKDIIKSYSSDIQDIFETEFDAISSYIDTAVVRQTDGELEITLENRTLDHKYINWYMCDLEDYCGTDTQWTHLGNVQNVSTWTFKEKPSESIDYLVRCVVTNSDLTTYEDFILVKYVVLRIAEIDISGIVTPVAGEAPSYEYILAEDAPFTVVSFSWRNSTDGKYMVKGEVFEEGKEYYVDLYLEPKPGYTFGDDYTEIDDFSSITINGDSALVDSEFFSVFDGTALLFSIDMQAKSTVSGILGDADDDGEVNILDATTIQRHVASIDVPNFNKKTADTDEDGEINVLDATLVQRWVAGLAPNSNIGKQI